MDHAAIMNSCSAKAERIGLANLSPTERVVVLVSWANFEIEMGGLDTFYYNSAGDEAVATVAALEAVGATRAASALRRANSLFPGGSPPREPGERCDGLQVVRGLPDDPLAALDDEFGHESPDVFDRLCSFIEAHADELQEHAVDGD